MSDRLDVFGADIADMEEKVDLLGEELEKEVWRLVEVIRILKKQLSLYDGHFTNLDKRVFDLEGKPQKPKSNYD